MADFPTGSLPRKDIACPTCGARAEEDQLVCLECGSRVALGYRRPPSWRVPAAILAAVVLLVLGGTAFAIKRIGDDAEREVRRTPVKLGRPAETKTSGEKNKEPAPEKDGAEKPAARQEPAENATPPTGGELVKSGAFYAWPRDLRAFTVVLLSAEDRASAERFARSASEGAPAKIGVIRADDFKSLPQGFYVVFAGQYADRAAADAATARLKERFSGAFPQLVER